MFVMLARSLNLLKRVAARPSRTRSAFIGSFTPFSKVIAFSARS
jgi:hypothetical protein